LERRDIGFVPIIIACRARFGPVDTCITHEETILTHY
jgi:hypothetical protein